MPRGRPTSSLDPTPASHTPLAGSEAAVPGEKRGPGAALQLRRSAHKDFQYPPCLKPQDLLGRERGGSQYLVYGGGGAQSLHTTIDFEFYNTY